MTEPSDPSNASLLTVETSQAARPFATLLLVMGIAIHFGLQSGNRSTFRLNSFLRAT